MSLVIPAKAGMTGEMTSRKTIPGSQSGMPIRGPLSLWIHLSKFRHAVDGKSLQHNKKISAFFVDKPRLAP
jgi:hypothetical protein